MKGVESQHTDFPEELICDAECFNPVPNIIDWYTYMDKVNDFVMIRLKQTLQIGLKIK